MRITSGRADLVDRARSVVGTRLWEVLRSERTAALLRRVALLRGFPEDGRATIVIVNWNTLPYLSVTLHALRRFASGVRVLVVDNGSDDGSREFLRRQPDVRSVLLPFNIHHGPALDIGVLLARTEFVVTLDVDAFPIGEDWLDRLLAPLGEGCEVSGVEAYRPFAHPSCLAMRRRRFVEQAHTLRANWHEAGLGESAWDVGELITMRERPNVRLYTASSVRGPGSVGSVWEGLVYHNFYASRHRASFGTERAGAIDGVRAEDADDAWDDAVRRYLGVDAAAWRTLDRSLTA